MPGPSLSPRAGPCHHDTVRQAPFWFLELCRPALWLLARLLFRIRVHGVGHVPRSGPVLIAPNHVSFMDPILVTIPIRRPLHYIALEPFLRIPVLGAIMRWARAFPVREDEVNSQAVRRALRLLQSGEALVVFPEGGRSADGRLQPFRSGAIRLALAADAPIVPVTIAGAFEAWPMHRRVPRPARVVVTYHPPLTRKDLPSGAPRKALPELMTDLVRQRITESLPPGFR